jgi:hypothetical protein
MRAGTVDFSFMYRLRPRGNYVRRRLALGDGNVATQSRYYRTQFRVLRALGVPQIPTLAARLRIRPSRKMEGGQGSNYGFIDGVSHPSGKRLTGTAEQVCTQKGKEGRKGFMGRGPRNDGNGGLARDTPLRRRACRHKPAKGVQCRGGRGSTGRWGPEIRGFLIFGGERGRNHRHGARTKRNVWSARCASLPPGTADSGAGDGPKSGWCAGQRALIPPKINDASQGYVRWGTGE